MSTILDWADERLASFLSQWDFYTVILGASIIALIAHTLLTAPEADLHPMILARQAYADRVRQPGESAVYRSPDAPHGSSLRSGLAVRLPTDKPYTSGRDGDLRHVWLRVMGEVLPPVAYGAQTGEEKKKTRIFTAMGREVVVDHDLQEMSKEIAVLGSYLQSHGSKRVAVFLPNTAEFLSTVFACAFYGLTVILLPYNRGDGTFVADLLKTTKADALIAPAGSVPLETLTKSYKSLKQVVWVVEKSSRHMDWTEIPSGLGESLDVSMLHQVVQDHQGNTPKWPEMQSADLGKIITIWQSEPSKVGDIVEFTHANFVAAIAALIAAVPTRERINSSDVFFSADSWTNSYCLCQTFAALYSGASLAITSVAGPDVDLTFAAKNILPTVAVASSDSVMRLHSDVAPSVKSGLGKLSHASQSHTLAAGAMPRGGLLTQIAGATKSAIGSTPGTLRLLFITEKAGTTNPPVSGYELNDLRIFTGARVVYALTAPAVAGAVAQTNIFDYRVDASLAKRSHFGIPLSSLEAKLVDSGTHKTNDDASVGEIVVSGPSVAGDTAKLGIMGTFRDDCTLAYA